MSTEYIEKRGSTVESKKNENGTVTHLAVQTPAQTEQLNRPLRRGEAGFVDKVDESKTKLHGPGAAFRGTHSCDILGADGKPCGTTFSGKGALDALEKHKHTEHYPNLTAAEVWMLLDKGDNDVLEMNEHIEKIQAQNLNLSNENEELRAKLAAVEQRTEIKRESFEHYRLIPGIEEGR